jgi:hypothetical protein
MTHRAREASQRRDHPARSVVWFVAADSDLTRAHAVQYFRPRLAQVSSGPVDLAFYGDTFLRGDSLAGVEAALIDLLLVTSADARVLTPGSSYSEFAWSMGRAPASTATSPTWSVFVESATPAGPRLCYDQVQPLSATAPFCVVPTSADPSTEDLATLVQDTPCRRKASTRPRKNAFASGLSEFDGRLVLAVTALMLMLISMGMVALRCWRRRRSTRSTVR